MTDRAGKRHFSHGQASCGILLSALIFCCGIASVDAADFEMQRLKLEVEGRTRRADLVIPETPVNPRALVLVFHGHGGSARRMARVTRFKQLAADEGIYVLFPEGTGWLNFPPRGWNAGYCCGYSAKKSINDLAFVDQLTKRVIDDYQIDRNRIFAAGVSNGGMMAYRLACDLPDLFAAVGVVAGSMRPEDCGSGSPVSVLSVHGREDLLVPYEGGISEHAKDGRQDASTEALIRFWAQRNACRASPRTEQSETWKLVEYADCAAGTSVKHYELIAQGHAWPGGRRGWWFGDKPDDSINATEALWQFFETHPKQAGLE